MAEHGSTDPVTPAVAADAAGAAAGGSVAGRSPPRSSGQSDEEQQSVEPLHLDDASANVPVKLRTYAIVAALYLVLLIAALDQTTIA